MMVSTRTATGPKYAELPCGIAIPSRPKKSRVSLANQSPSLYTKAACTTTPRIPIQYDPVAICSIAPVKVICQMFQISTFTTRVIRVTSITILTAMATGIATRAICDAQVIGDEPGQPMSIT